MAPNNRNQQQSSAQDTNNQANQNQQANDPSGEPTAALPNDQAPRGPLAADAAPTHYQIMRGQVGPHAEGAVVPAGAFNGVDLQFLLDAGVIAPADAPEQPKP